MQKVTRKQLWRGFILFTISCNIVGVGLGMYVQNHWSAFGHAASAIMMTLLYLETLEQGEEDSDDEQ